MINRRNFNKILGLSMIGLTSIDQLTTALGKFEKSDITMPMIFVGHGNPMNAVEENEFTKAWAEIGKSIPKPKAILSVSAHWLTNGTFVTTNENPKTIYDFYGFPDVLFQQKYPAPGSVELANNIISKIKEPPVKSELNWGLDHGTWSVLIKMYPKADIPVIQLSIDENKDADFHYYLGKKLAFLRNRGVLIFCSGNIVHNLRRIKWEGGKYDWAIEFDELVKNKIDNRDFKSLIDYEKFGNSAKLSIPTNDHYLPLLYALGAAEEKSNIKYFNDDIVMGSLAMRSLLIQ
jgi:4,5-DOPA dioxygenase extradiol